VVGKYCWLSALRVVDKKLETTELMPGVRRPDWGFRGAIDIEAVYK
jgi:hypothetical protein